jgi:aminopeptidase N
MSHYPSAYEIDRSKGAHPIQQPLDNLRNAGSVYGAIIYQKAPIMMRNLEAWMGPDNFRMGLQDYLKTYAFGNATWDDLVRSLKTYTKEDLEIWNNAWIKTAGMPEIEITQNPDGKKFLEVTNDSSGIVWPQVVTYKIKAKYINHAQDVTFRTSSRALLSKWVEPDMKFIPNYKGKGYGYFKAAPEYLLAEVYSQQDVEVRAGIWMNLWETFLRGGIPTTPFFDRVLEAVVAEHDPLLLEYLTDKLDRIFWQFLSLAERTLISPDLDRRIFDRLVKEKDQSCKRTLFNTYRSLAISKEGVAHLKELWADEIQLGLELSERDHIQLAYALAVREAEGHEDILRQQLSSLTNPDRKAEMEFVMPAVSPDPAVRAAFFEGLKDRVNRTREPWVLEAVRYLHHPLRAEKSVSFVYPSLLLLEELQRTGDIFFPKGWLDATLGGHQSREAAEAVRKYLEENKTLRQDLRNKLLQSSDMLFRAQEMNENSEMGSLK